MSAEALTIRAGAADLFMPAMSIANMIARRAILVQVSQNAELMQKDFDYGMIPGTNKNTLYKPGAEKLCTIFGLQPVFDLVRCVEDWTGEAHGGEAFFYYVYSCSLFRDGVLMAKTEASCNSWEPKYRYRNTERRCPRCDAAAISKSKEEYGGGFYCANKKGGCGAKFSKHDPEITNQEVGKMANPDAAEGVNTFQKMAQKRALIGTTLVAVNASEFYTQDIEDLTTIEAEFVPTTAQSEQDPEPLPTIEEAVGILKTVAGEYLYQGKLSAIRPLLVSDVPLAKWTAETYMTAARRPPELWRLAIASLAPPVEQPVSPEIEQEAAAIEAHHAAMEASAPPPQEPNPWEEDDYTEFGAPNLTLLNSDSPRPIITAGGSTVAAMTR